MLAFWFLAHSEKPRTKEQLDATIENFLVEVQTVAGFNECKIDFEVELAAGWVVL
jgi:hypothetical protein